MTSRTVGTGLTRRLMVAAAALLLCGLVVDQGFARRQVATKRQLQARRSAVALELEPFQKRDSQVRTMAAALGKADLASGIEALRAGDPVAMLSRMVSASGLSQRELATEKVSDEGGVRRTRFFVRASGRYTEIVNLVRSLEQGDQIVSVDALSIAWEDDGSALEARMNVSVFTP